MVPRNRRRAFKPVAVDLLSCHPFTASVFMVGVLVCVLVVMGGEVDHRPVRVEVKVLGKSNIWIFCSQTALVNFVPLHVADHVESAQIQIGIHDCGALVDIVFIDKDESPDQSPFVPQMYRQIALQVSF